jgi:polyferredoxin
MNLSYVGWHLPAAYELALRSAFWHEVEHGCFFITSVLFWWTIIQPWPSKPHFSRWVIVPYMLGAAVVNTALSASFAFSSHVFYPTYTRVPRLSGLSALDDQSAAGDGMWVIGSIFLFLPAMVIVYNLLSPRKKTRAGFVILQPKPVSESLDLLRTPWIGPLLRSRYGRMILQSISLIVASFVIAHGLWGPQIGAMNLACVVPWNIIRVLGVLVLIFAGNLFCMACPFMLPRELTRLVKLRRYKWPLKLRRKWLAASLMLLFFFAFEQWSIWDVPRRTAVVLLSYFIAAFLVDAIFTGASFCKYVCPIGQFNFISSLISPLELSIRSKSICSSCVTRDCIRGNERQRGCELQLYLPQKKGNIDCTLCMDCVKACPHENVQITAMNPVRDLLRDPQRSSVGQLSKRCDIVAIIRLIVFNGFGSAFVMLRPVVDMLNHLRIQFSSFGPVLQPGTCLLLFLSLLMAIELVITRTVRMFGLLSDVQVRSVTSRFIFALLPLGVTMWAAHLVFHLGAGLPSLWPTLQQAASEFVSSPLLNGSAIGGHVLQRVFPLGVPQWTIARCIRAETLMQIQFALLETGLLVSLYVGWRLAGQFVKESGRRTLLWATWAIAVFCLYALGLWILMQPMEMRGMVMS